MRKSNQPYQLEFLEGKNPDRPMTGAEKVLTRVVATAVPVVLGLVTEAAGKYAGMPEGTTHMLAVGLGGGTLFFGHWVAGKMEGVDQKWSQGHGDYTYKNQPK